MGYIRCYAYFLKHLSFLWRFQQEGVGLWGDFTGKFRTQRIIQTFISRNPVPCCSFETQVVTSSCNFTIFAFSNFAELTLFHIIADDRQKCHAFPEPEENRTLKQKRFLGNSSKIQVATSQREFTFLCLSKLLFKVSMVIFKKIE